MGIEFRRPDLHVEGETKKNGLAPQSKNENKERNTLEDQMLRAVHVGDQKTIQRIVEIKRRRSSLTMGYALHENYIEWVVDKPCTSDKEEIFDKARYARSDMGEQAFVKAARNVCMNCKVLEECHTEILKSKLDDMSLGVVAGMTFKERSDIRVKQRLDEVKKAKEGK